MLLSYSVSLRRFNTHIMQIIKIKDIMRPPEKDEFNDVYIAYELMETDLHQIIRSSQALTEDHCQVLLFTAYNALSCKRTVSTDGRVL